MKATTLLVPLVLGATLAACGGGGGGGGEGEQQQFPSTINSSNAQDVAAHAYASSQELNDRRSAGGIMSTNAQAGAPDTSRGLVDASLSLLYRGLDAQAAGILATGVGATGTDSWREDCSGGGSISYTVNFSDPNRVSNGDRLTMTANNCIENGVSLNGKISYLFGNVSGAIGSDMAWSATLGLTHSNFSVASNADAVRINGDLTMAYVQFNTTTADFSVTGRSLQVTVIENSAVVIDQRLTAFDYTGAINGSNITYSADYTLSGSFPNLGKATYTIDTVTPFQMMVGSNPSAGVLTVTATDKTRLWLYAIDTTSVRLEIDNNGDDIVDEVIATTWAELSNSL